MISSIQPIATITTTSGLKGEVRVRPLSRYFDEYVEERNLMLGSNPDVTKKIKLEIIKGIGKKRRFKFVGVDSFTAAERIIGKTIFVKANHDDKIIFIGKELLGFRVVTDTGLPVGI